MSWRILLTPDRDSGVLYVYAILWGVPDLRRSAAATGARDVGAEE